jgi:(p)ppGpp synthase/HD superfamily hydrolase
MHSTAARQLSYMIEFVAKAFVEDDDKGGTPYILHCIHVMNITGKKTDNDFEAMAIAVGHDLNEEYPKVWEILLRTGILSDRVIEGVETMTHDKKRVPYMEYIIQCSKNPDTRLIKMIDIKHNSDPHRLKELSEKGLARIEKYHRAYQYLKAVKE